VGVVRPSVRDSAAVGPALPHALRRAYGDHVLGRPERRHRVGRRARVARRHDLHHLLVARGPRLRVSYKRVELLRVRDVGTPGRGTPGVVRDACSLAVGAARERRDRAGEPEQAVAPEDLGSAELCPRRHAQAVVEAARVLDRRVGAVVESTDDRRVDGCVAPAVPRVWIRGEVVGVRDPARVAHVSALVEVREVGAGGARVEPLVGHVHDERERRRAEPERVVEREVAGTRGHQRVGTGERPGDDLVSDLVL
jgi:hypothetical protein